MKDKIPEWMVQLAWTDKTIHRFAQVFNDKILSLEKRILELEKQQDKEDDKPRLVTPEILDQRRYRWIKKGKESKRICGNEVIPEGWVLGRYNAFNREKGKDEPKP